MGSSGFKLEPKLPPLDAYRDALIDALARTSANKITDRDFSPDQEITPSKTLQNKSHLNGGESI